MDATESTNESTPAIAPPAKPSLDLPTLSPEELHLYLLKAFTIGNRAKRKLIDGLLHLHESRFYLLLGYSSIFQYAEKFFGYQRTETYEALRVGKALRNLSRSAAAFRDGTLSYSSLREITRVASEETEGAWLEFARGKSYRALKAEVEDALKKKRKLPRGDRYGLPSLPVRVTFELSPNELELLQKALGKARSEIKTSLGEEAEVEPKKALLFLAERMLETDPIPRSRRHNGTEGTPGGRSEREGSIYTILYHVCPTCRKSHVWGSDGPVEVSSEVVERVEGEAKKVTIDPAEEVGRSGSARDTAGADEASVPVFKDRPNTPRLRRRVLLRDGSTCANPRCRRKLGLMAHHLVFRSEGGPTEIQNETAVCAVCHALLHQGYLEVSGSPLNGLRWRARADGLKLSLEEEREELAYVPVLRHPMDVKGREVMENQSGCPDESGRPDKIWGKVLGRAAERGKILLSALTALGFSKTEARERALEVLERVGDRAESMPEGDLIKEAFRRSA